MALNYRKIMVAVDLTKNSIPVVEAAIELAEKFDSKVQVIHVLPEIHSEILHYVSVIENSGDIEKLKSDYRKKSQKIVTEKILKLIKSEIGDKVREEYLTDVAIHFGSPSQQILEAADKTNADLIVIGAHGKDRLGHALLGSEAEKLVKKTTRPLLMVPLVH